MLSAATVAFDDGNVIVVESAPTSAIELFAVSVFALATVNTPPAVEVMARPLTVVAVAAPSVGVVKDGDEARATAPVPVFVVTATPLMENELPAAAVSNVLFVNVSVVALPTMVSFAFGTVSVRVVPVEMPDSSNTI